MVAGVHGASVSHAGSWVDGPCVLWCTRCVLRPLRSAPVGTTYFEKIGMHEQRFLIWKYSFEILKETNLITGNGYSKTTEKLVNEYKNISQEKKRNWFIDKEFNTHNQYLDILISQGVLAALIFIVFLVQVFKVAKKSHTNILLLTSMLIYMTVYNNFHRLIGVYLFSLILIVILSKDNSKKTIE